MNRISLPPYYAFLSPFMDHFYELQDKTEIRKEDIKKEWQKTYSMPRKMKKQRRKELEIDWQIANWDLGF
jgi:hypothetical protein